MTPGSTRWRCSGQTMCNSRECAEDSLWKAKRLQTGLASWATLRHATVLVNEQIRRRGGRGRL